MNWIKKWLGNCTAVIGAADLIAHAAVTNVRTKTRDALRPKQIQQWQRMWREAMLTASTCALLILAGVSHAQTYIPAPPRQDCASLGLSDAMNIRVLTPSIAVGEKPSIAVRIAYADFFDAYSAEVIGSELVIYTQTGFGLEPVKNFVY